MTEEEKALDKLIHGVKSKCGPLLDAAERLRAAPLSERREILALMLPRAQRVVDLLTAYEAEIGK
jgi:hypothetical protein